MKNNVLGNLKKVLALALSLIMILSLVTGCTSSKNTGKTEDGKTLLIVGDCPAEDTNPEQYKSYVEKVAAFEERHPDIKVEMDTYKYDVQNFMAKFEADTLPTIYYAPMTEAKMLIENGCAADITEQFKARGYYDAVNPFMFENISKDGSVYLLPSDCYDVGIFMNMDILEQAGLVSEDGTPHEPQTWEELAEMAVTIKEKTGKSGFILSTTNNTGGWRFTPIAWSFGTTFMEKDSEGNWQATFDSDECAAALQFVKDLKWKYDVLPENALVDNAEVQTQMAIGSAAMAFGNPQFINECSKKGMKPESVGLVRMPSGPERRVSMMGGGYRVINANATPDQIEAALIYAEEMYGITVNITDAIKENVVSGYEDSIAQGFVVGMYTLTPWKADNEVQSFKIDKAKEMCNVNYNHIALYNNKDDIEYQSEEPVEAQALYALLDTCIQEVLTNKDADCKALLKKAASDFQHNYLDYEN